jgi:hypothetical protein
MFIPGFTFPVREFYKADYEAVVREFKDFTTAGKQRGGVNVFCASQFQVGLSIGFDFVTLLGSKR